MSFLSSRPVTVCLALVAAVVWAAGNRNKNRTLVGVGIALTAAAAVTYFLGY